LKCMTKGNKQPMRLVVKFDTKTVIVPNGKDMESNFNMFGS
jgi:hypothetical protein